MSRKNHGRPAGGTEGTRNAPGPPADADPIGMAVHDRPEGARLSVQVKPRASRTQFLGVREGALVVAVAAAPVDGEANAALVRAVAELLGVARRSVVIATGHGSKRKIVDVLGIDANAVCQRLRAES